jgi:hypothetical protein
MNVGHFAKAGALVGAGIAALSLWFAISRAPELSSQAPPVEDHSASVVVQPSGPPNVNETSNGDRTAEQLSTRSGSSLQSGWLTRMSQSTDYYELAQQAIDAAMAGDADTQFMQSRP